MSKQKNFFQIDELEQQRERSGKSYLEFLRIPSMSAGVYTLAGRKHRSAEASQGR